LSPPSGSEQTSLVLAPRRVGVSVAACRQVPLLLCLVTTGRLVHAKAGNEQSRGARHVWHALVHRPHYCRVGAYIIAALSTAGALSLTAYAHLPHVDPTANMQKLSLNASKLMPPVFATTMTGPL